MADATGHAAPPRIETVRFLADGDVPRVLAQDVVARVSRRLVVPCRLDNNRWAHAPARLPGREQVDADALLGELEAGAVPGTILVGLTGLDVGISIFTFVFGRATVGGTAAVVSLARLAPERYGLRADHDLFARRAAMEVLHELGHVGGLGHCDDFNCIMHFAPSVESIDVRGPRFCPGCLSSLPRNLLAGMPS